MVRAVFMGSDWFSVPVLNALIARGPELRPAMRLVGVVTQPDRPAGRGRKLTGGPVKASALDAGLLLLQPEGLRKPPEIQPILDLHPDLIVVASYGRILPRQLLHAVRHGCLNLHPSLLPRFRGPSPIESAILEGESRTGVSLMLMEQQMDAGPILRQCETDVGPTETAGELGARLANMSGELLVDCLPQWMAGQLPAVPQEDSAATYTPRISKADGIIDWTSSAETLSRRVRAFNPWPGATTIWKGRTLRLLRARPSIGSGTAGRVEAVAQGSLVVGTGCGLLLVDELQLAGGRATAAADIARGYPDLISSQLGMDAEWSSA